MVSFIDILWGLLLLSSWGVADFLARSSAIRIGSVPTAFMVQALGLVVPMVAVAISLGAGSGLDVDVAKTAWFALLTGGILGLAYVVYYTGFERGSVSMVSSVASAWLVVTILIAAIFFGESVTWGQAALIAVVMTGILSIGLKKQEIGAPESGIRYGLGGMLLLGTALALWAPLTDAAGPLLAVLTARAVSVVVTAGYMNTRGIGIRWPSGRTAGLVLASAAFLDALGFVAYNIGIDRVSLVVIAPFGAAHPVGTIILAFLILHERPAKLQWAGMALTVAGVVALSTLAGV
ncbi:MAG: DMT family transporter [Chloroflexi bacterium]|nr:DMT family transporter [Chloroflexota bacterium]